MINNKIENLKNTIEEAETIKGSINRLLHIYGDKYDQIVKAQNDIKNDISKMETEVSNYNRDKGILIDYKTFSEIVNVLSIAKSYGDCSQEFFDKIIKLGKDNEKKPASRFELEPVEKPTNIGNKFILNPTGRKVELNDDSNINKFLNRSNKTVEDEDLKMVVQKQFEDALFNKLAELIGKENMKNVKIIRS